MGIAAELSVKWNVRQSGDNDFGGPEFRPVIESMLSLTDGTGANAADIFWADERSVNASSNDDLDLAGVLADAFGDTVAGAEAVALILINKPRSGNANVSDLTVGGGSNPFVGFLGGTAPTIGPIKPGGMLCLWAGDAAGIGAISAGDGDILRIANGSGGTAVYQIALLARSA